MIQLNPSRTRNVIVKAAISVAVSGVIASSHHIYGAVLYETPWRLVVSLWIPVFVVLILAMLYVHWKFADRLTGTFAVWVVFLGGGILQTGFTLFECVYSHVLKIILYFGGASETILERLFPAPAYHLPDNLFFELTGVLQLTGFGAAWWAWCVFAQRARSR